MTDRRVLKPYIVEIPLAAGRDEAWKAVTKVPVLHQWFGWDYDGLDAEIRQIFVDQAALLAPERMGWADGSYLEVTGDDRTSTVRVTREGPMPGDPDAFDAIEEGWRAFLTQLAFYLDRRPKGRRRTLYLTGSADAGRVLTLLDEKWNRVGSRVAWAADGEDLVLVAGHAHLDAGEMARVDVTVSTFGLADDAFAERQEAWRRRWTSIADSAAVTHAATPAPH